MEFMSKWVWQQMTDEAPSILQTPVPDGYTSDGFAAAALKQCGVIATAGHRLRTVGRRIFLISLFLPGERLPEAERLKQMRRSWSNG
ncbi:hypothetical protein FE784_13705 [Paenibacillus hemerocallicola]|uniref:Uncharacterized protein n=1 Tax=Paenibacillus hemerocallicola TaxID=1172614 RepID=A0A5C4T9Y7_9BACL|nr:hypothetical protein [Paenibacillus hemerocallicola]TNJ65705.1 hypothetical protein FE784_13705 [Paenibacillus hemerocallicola]